MIYERAFARVNMVAIDYFFPLYRGRSESPAVVGSQLARRQVLGGLSEDHGLTQRFCRTLFSGDVTITKMWVPVETGVAEKVSDNSGARR
jgi:hypothetical protein